MQLISLNGVWRVRPDDLSCTGTVGRASAVTEQEGWIEARVPGEIHLDLMRAGQMEEPLFSTNTQSCRWPEEHSWWFVTACSVSAAFLNEERQQLIFDGMDLYAQVFLNGALIGEATNAFVPAIFDVKGLLREGENELVVRLTVGTELTADKPFPEGHQQGEGIYGHRDYHQRRWLRKPQFSFGWDWADALPNIGIWRGVRLEGHSQAVIQDLRLDTVIQGPQVFVSLDAILENLHPYSERACTLELTLTAPDGTRVRRRYALDLQPGRSPLQDWIEIPEPQLWWPNGMGEQPLYHVTARLLHGKRVCDEHEYRIGLRVIEVDRSRLAEGSRFCIRVNGHDVFCKGGNWVPADSILARVDHKKYEALVEAAKDANLNMLRVWGGGIYEAPAFYEACDRAGILIWQDFMFACKLYPDYDPAFRAAVRNEALAVVRSLRHHPCIALWSGNNENLWGFAEWWTSQPDNFAGSTIYNQILPEVCHALDPERVYWPSSPAGGDTPNSETAGDCHWWGFYGKPMEEFPLIHERFDSCRARFVSEYGMIGPLHEASLKECLKPEERRRNSLAFQIHTNTSTAAPVEKGIALNYAEPGQLSLREFTLYGQMFQALFYGGTVEALRFRRYDPNDDCQGALIWMYNDCWGEMGWTPIDYYLRRKASYYWLKRACKPVKVIVRRRGRQLITRIVNDTRQAYRGEVRLGWLRLDGSDTRIQDLPVFIPTNSMIEVATERIPAKRELDPRHWLYAAILHDGDRFEPDEAIYPLLPPRQLALAPPRIFAKIEGREIELTSQVYCHAVHAEDGGRGLLSDNFFELLPGMPKRITYFGKGNPENLRFVAIVPPGRASRVNKRTMP